MFRVTISGKPSNWQDMPDSGEASKYVGCFDLRERHWDGTTAETVVHRCYVPQHRAKWAKTKAEKGFLVIVEADQLFSGQAEALKGEVAGLNLGLTDIIEL